MKQLILIGGPMGVGKTTVCQILKKRLDNAVFLDGDWCWDADPFQNTEETRSMVLDNICFLLRNFLSCSAYENVLFCWVLHDQAILDEILSRLPVDTCRILSVSLLADEPVLKERIGQDVQKGLRSWDVLERSLERLPHYDSLTSEKIRTDGRSPDEVAGLILERLEARKQESRKS